MIYDLCIIGGGPCGLTAALYAIRAGLKTVLFCGNLEMKGGLLTKTSIVENFPGFPDGILGFDLIENIEKQCEKQGLITIEKVITKVNFSEIKGYTHALKTEDGVEYSCKSVLIATGSTPNKLRLPNEDNLWAKGISSCAVCDAPLYKNKKIVVVGGGDSAMEEALYLSKISEVLLIHRGTSFRASKVMQERVFANERIKVSYNTKIIKLIGKDKLESIDIMIGAEVSNIPVDGLFYGLGLKPNSSLFVKSGLRMNSTGHIEHDDFQTNIDGVFVSGDVTDEKYRQAITAAGDGCKAALEIIQYLQQFY